jgi:hypothetical protein
MVPLPFWQWPAGSSIKAKRALILTFYFGLLMLSFPASFSRALPPRSIGVDWRRAVAGFGG